MGLPPLGSVAAFGGEGPWGLGPARTPFFRAPGRARPAMPESLLLWEGNEFLKGDKFLEGFCEEYWSESCVHGSARPQGFVEEAWQRARRPNPSGTPCSWQVGVGVVSKFQAGYCCRPCLDTPPVVEPGPLCGLLCCCHGDNSRSWCFCGRGGLCTFPQGCQDAAVRWLPLVLFPAPCSAPPVQCLLCSALCLLSLLAHFELQTPSNVNDSVRTCRGLMAFLGVSMCIIMLRHLDIRNRCTGKPMSMYL